MKIFTLFLIALTAFVFVTPANAQRRNREAQKQTTEQQKQPDTSGNGRREKRLAPKVPLVPCTLTLDDAPSLRGFLFGQSLSQVKGRFAGTRIAITGVNMPISNEKPFFQQYVLYSNSAVTGNETSVAEEAANSRYSGNRTTSDGQKSWDDIAAGIARKTQTDATFKDIKEIRLFFYGANDNPTLYAYDLYYIPTLTFDSTQAVKELFLSNFNIPVDSWVPASEDRKRVNDWVTNCNGWRAVFETGTDNTGLFFSAINAEDEKNLANIKKNTEKKKTEGFKP
jgi:hypothetical protein